MAEFAKRLIKNRTFRALSLLGLGTLLLACLYSFNTLSAARGQLVDPSAHILGSIGYSLAYGCYWLLGWSVWLVVVVMLAIGCMMLVNAKPIKWLYVLALLLASCGLCSMLSLQNVLGAEWLQRHALPSTGGKTGQLLADMLLALMPRGVALLVSFCVYFIGLVWLLKLRLKQVAAVLFEDLKKIALIARQGWLNRRSKRQALQQQATQHQSLGSLASTELNDKQQPGNSALFDIPEDTAERGLPADGLAGQSELQHGTQLSETAATTAGEQTRPQEPRAQQSLHTKPAMDTQIVIWPAAAKPASSEEQFDDHSADDGEAAPHEQSPALPASLQPTTPAQSLAQNSAPQPELQEDEQHEDEQQEAKITIPLQTLASARSAEPPRTQNAPAAQPAKPAATCSIAPATRAVTTTAAAATGNGSTYVLPDINMLHFNRNPAPPADPKQLQAVMDTIVKTLQSFGVNVRPGNITSGPSITRYEIYPSEGLRVSRITQLEADLSRATRAEQINILAPIPGKDTVGIEIANPNRTPVELGELLHDAEFTNPKYKIPLALGKDVYGNTLIGDLASMPHLLVAGATGSGKSVCINSIVSSMLLRFSPDDLRFILIDPKVVEMQGYGRLPHLIVPVVTDPKKVIAALRWAVNEMEKRYRCFAKVGVRNFIGYNNYQKKQAETAGANNSARQQSGPESESEVEVDYEKIEAIVRSLENPYEEEPPMEKPEPADCFDFEELPQKLPYIVIIIDELADLMQTAPADMESYIARITQKARAAGIHLIVATQTPRAEVVTGIIKANIPSRIAFQVASALDSRVILDQKGAEKLLGKGDCMYLAPGAAKMERAQGAFISDEDVEHLVEFCSNQIPQNFLKDVQQSIEEDDDCEYDPQDTLSNSENETYQKCLEVVRIEKKASASLLQRRLRLGYNKAARMMDMLEEKGVVGPQDGAKPREIFLND